jgi:Domain of unknown function (DUF932)
MHTTPSLATRFARNTRVLRAEVPLTEEQMRAVAPSIFAEGRHPSRSERYAYIPTIDVLRSLRGEGFEPVMVAQGASRVESRAAFTKHLVRLRHAGQARERPEVPEVVLINSHDGASCYQLLAGLFRLICCNGLVIGDGMHDIRVPHKGRAHDEVIEGAVRVLGSFSEVEASIDAMKAIELRPDEEQAFGESALALRFGARGEDEALPPITAEHLLEARRIEDVGHSLWHVLQRAQENALRGGQPGRSSSGRRLHTRAVQSIDRSVALNRALWRLAEDVRRGKTLH